MPTSNGPQGRSFLRTALSVFLWWNPLITLGMVLFFYGPRHFVRTYAVCLFISTIVAATCMSSTWVARVIEQRIATRRRQLVAKHSRAWYFALSMMAMPVGLYLGLHAASHLFGIELSADISDYRFGALLGVTASGAFFLWQTRSDARDSARVAELRVRELEKTALEAQLAALTAQMNPHFLFNALNTVAALVHSDPDKAEGTIVRLAELYRGVLAASRRTTHTLDDELCICEAYLEIEKARFGDRLTTGVELPGDLRTQNVVVPVLVLQHLVENAVKHGLSQRAEGGTVTIRGRVVEGRDGQAGARALEMDVEDDGVGIGHSKQRGAGTGIANARDRLRLSYGKRASLELAIGPSGGTRATLRMPIDGAPAIP